MLNKKALAATSGVSQYQIERSLRFNSADSAYLNRTLSAGNRKTWTWSGWVKRSAFDTFSTIFCGNGGTSDATFTEILFRSDQFQINGYNTVWRRSTAVYRDPSAWYHLVVAFDTTQATASNRVKLYVNGTQVTDFAISNDPTQNTDYGINAAVTHGIGSIVTGEYYNGYMTDVYFIDGQALTPSSFGETDADTGIWKPKAFSGTYGTNGFYLDFSDNSGTTSTTLGKDYSGNSNNFTPNNFSVTAGVGNDSLVDTPTPYGTDTGAGGEVRGNYCTLNPLTTTAGTYTQGNLRYVGASAWRRSNATIPVSTGKWYWEVTLGNAPYTPRSSTTGYNAMGFGLTTAFNSTSNLVSFTDAVMLGDNGHYKNFSGSVTDTGTAFSSGDVLAIAVDLDANTFTFYRNNSSVGSGTIGGTAGRELVPCLLSYDGTQGVMDCNFGQRPFAYTAPSGYKALCTANLPTPTIGATATTRADDYFDTGLYTGNGSSSSRAISGPNNPDFVWIKSRSDGSSHALYDVNRGFGKRLYSNVTNSEYDYGSTILTPTSTGFNLTTADADHNTNNTTYVAWQWKGGGTGVSNTAGSITSTVSANTTAGFSVVTYTSPNNTSNQTVGHGLGVKPSLIIVKNRDQSYNWDIYHSSLGYNSSLTFTTNATRSGAFGAEPTSTVFTTVNDYTHTSTNKYVAYCFAPVAGFSAFGSYTGNGSTDGPFIYTGFRPAFIIVKQTNTGGENWYLMDNKRSTFNLVNDTLYPNQSSAETVDNANVTCDFTSNGFKIRDSYTGWNANGGTYIYACFAENPFKYSLAR